MESYLDYVDRSPYGYYRRMQEQGSVYWDDRMRAWLVFGYDECRRVETDEQTFAHPYHQFAGAADVQGGPRGILMLRGHEHQAMHRFMLAHFSPRVVAGYRDSFIRALVDRWLGTIDPSRPVDLAGEVFEQLPSDVIAAMLGLEWADEALLQRCKHWNDAIMRWSETFGEDEAILAEALDAAKGLEETILPVIRARRQEPRDDFISVLWREGPRLLNPWTEREVLAQCRVLFFAGSETTFHFLNNVTHALVDHPEHQARLREQRDEIPAYVEELLRFYGVIHFRVRVAAQDVELGGVTIKQGDRVHPINSAANRDPHQFDNPDAIEPGRPQIKSHLAFNIGPRFCVGANLARAESVEVVEALLRRYESLSWAPGSEPGQFLGHMPRSFRPLHVQLAPAA